jgi:hypothetical protein
MLGEIISIIFITSMAIYFLPSIIAFSRHKKNSVAIFVLNLLLGWSFIGWAAALIWALVNDETGPQAKTNSANNGTDR